jgi:hypothetical protein
MNIMKIKVIFLFIPYIYIEIYFKIILKINLFYILLFIPHVYISLFYFILLSTINYN